MALSLSTIAAKDSAGTAIAGGLLAGDKSGAGTGPFILGNIVVDGLAGTNVAAVTAANAMKVDGSAVTQPVSLASVPSHAVTNAGTFAVQNTAATPAGTNIVGKVGIDQTTDGTTNLVAAKQNGTWTVQPGNTANTTAWKVQLYDGTTALPILAASTGVPASTAPALAVSVRDANANGQTTMSASAPVAIASDQTIPIKAVTASSGATNSRVVAAATTNATNLKASAGNIFSIRVFNVAAYDVFLKLYNKASAPTVGTDTPVWTIPIKAGTGFSEHFHLGFQFGTGIAYAITKLQADTDTTAVAASDVTGTIGWI